jgi:hypothetical protein
MSGPQPNETIESLQQLNSYHAFKRMLLDYTLIVFFLGGGNEILRKFHFMHKIMIQGPMEPRPATGPALQLSPQPGRNRINQ